MSAGIVASAKERPQIRGGARGRCPSFLRPQAAVSAGFQRNEGTGVAWGVEGSTKPVACVLLCIGLRGSSGCLACAVCEVQIPLLLPVTVLQGLGAQIDLQHEIVNWHPSFRTRCSGCGPGTARPSAGASRRPPLQLAVEAETTQRPRQADYPPSDYQKMLVEDLPADRWRRIVLRAPQVLQAAKHQMIVAEIATLAVPRASSSSRCSHLFSYSHWLRCM